MENCIFCKVVRGELPSYKIYEDELFMVMLDIFPASKGHTLIIPKAHYIWTHDVPEFGIYWEVALRIKKAIDRALNPKWVQYLTHGVIPHAHIHVIPRYENIDDVHVIPSQGKLKLGKEEFEEIAAKIKASL